MGKKSLKKCVTATDILHNFQAFHIWQDWLPRWVVARHSLYTRKLAPNSNSHVTQSPHLCKLWCDAKLSRHVREFHHVTQARSQAFAVMRGSHPRQNKVWRQAINLSTSVPMTSGNWIVCVPQAVKVGTLWACWSVAVLRHYFKVPLIMKFRKCEGKNRSKVPTCWVVKTTPCSRGWRHDQTVWTQLYKKCGHDVMNMSVALECVTWCNWSLEKSNVISVNCLGMGSPSKEADVCPASQRPGNSACIHLSLDCVCDVTCCITWFSSAPALKKAREIEWRHVTVYSCVWRVNKAVKM